MYSKSKWSHLVSSLIRETQEGELQWSACDDQDVKRLVSRDGSGAFSASYRKREFLIFDIPKRPQTLREVAEGLGNPMLDPMHERVRLYMTLKDSSKYIRVPSMRSIFDLYNIIYSTHVDLDELL